MNHDYISCSAQWLNQQWQQNQWQANHIVNQHIARIQSHHDALNALVVARYSLARAEALNQDQYAQAERAAQPWGGVPFVTKEMLGVAQLPQTMGSWYRHADTASADATVVNRLRAAGAILLGQTNQGEMGLGLDCNNKIYGRTVNPWDKKHSCGEDGSAALVGSGGAPLALSGDMIGNSLVSAHFCGIFAHRPTRGCLPLTGFFPLTEAEADDVPGSWAKVSNITLLGHHVGDLSALLPWMAGPDGIDPGCSSLPLNVPPTEVAWEIHLWDKPHLPLCRRPSEEIAAAVSDAAEDLADTTDGTVNPWQPPDKLHPLQLWGGVAQSSGEAIAEILARGDHIALGTEWQRWLCQSRLSKHTTASLVGCLLEQWLDFAHQPYQQPLVTLSAELTDLLQPGHILVMPVFPRVAPKLRKWPAFPWEYGYTALWAAMGFPSTVVPVGFNWQGLPLGVQLIGAPGMDLWTLKAATDLAALRPRWQPPRYDTVR